VRDIQKPAKPWQAARSTAADARAKRQGAVD
jgi:hypothetical protein